MTGVPMLSETWGTRPSFLLICDEWTPTHGGISTFNREMATALARAGYTVLCLVESATPGELADAQARGVRLVIAERTPEGANLFVPVDSVLEFQPNVVVGHDRISGAVAWTYVRKYLTYSPTLVHVVHTAPHEIEPYKGREGWTKRVEKREGITRQIAQAAKVVAAVGPHLASYADSVMGDKFDRFSVLQLDPGMTVASSTTGVRVPRTRPIVLLLGRAEDVELKGLDIAAQSVAGLAISDGGPSPELLVRGAPENECESLHMQLVGLSTLARSRVSVRPYSDDLEQVRTDLQRAALCVLPSRAEGFGLAALEAIGLGTPVLVSDKSGLAQTLFHLLGREALPMIVGVVDNLQEDVRRWTAAIQGVLNDLPKAFTYADEIRAKLRAKLSWSSMAETLVERIAVPSPAVSA